MSLVCIHCIFTGCELRQASNNWCTNGNSKKPGAGGRSKGIEYPLLDTSCSICFLWTRWVCPPVIRIYIKFYSLIPAIRSRSEPWYVLTQPVFAWLPKQKRTGGSCNLNDKQVSKRCTQLIETECINICIDGNVRFNVVSYLWIMLCIIRKGQG